MTQIPQNPSLLGGLGGLGGQSNSTSQAGRKDVAGTGQPAFAQWLTQSSQQWQAKAPSPAPTTPAAAKPPAPQASKPAGRPETSAAQEENKLAARNTAARQQANRSAEASKPASRAPERPEAEDARQPVRATGQAATDEVQARTTDTETDAPEKKDEASPAGTPTQQMLALLRGDVPADVQRSTAANGDAADAESVQAGGASHAHAKHHDASALMERQQLQQEQRDAAQGQLAESADRKEALQAVSSGAQELPMADKAPASAAAPQSFEAMLAAAQQAQGAGAAEGPGAPAAADAPQIPLSQPLDSPEFAPELSASVSLLIKDGIHEAQLQLNPTDMGPVSIQIQVDGQQAQVNFHAEQAATRDALERSLPDLAAALQNQGLTLSGGGVFAQQSGGQRDRDASGDGDRRRGGARGEDDVGLAATGRPERQAKPRGLVDLYA